MTDQKQPALDPDGTRIALSLKQIVIFAVVLFSGAVTFVGYSVLRDVRIEHAFEKVHSIMENAAKATAAKDENLILKLNEVRDAVKQITVDTVTLRQWMAWLDVCQLTIQSWTERLKADNPTVKVPDLKLPSLPR